jgi:hypothetical protein
LQVEHHLHEISKLNLLTRGWRRNPNRDGTHATPPPSTAAPAFAIKGMAEGAGESRSSRTETPWAEKFEEAEHTDLHFLVQLGTNGFNWAAVCASIFVLWSESF